MSMPMRQEFAPQHRSHIAVMCGGLLILLMLVCRVAPAQTTFGTLSNFDVFNDSGEEAHGFEIELEGLSRSDVSFTFGMPYQRYGDPSVVEFASGVYVRYESPYDAAQHVFTAATPLAPSVITPTDGHACWTGGSGNYLTSGCEHFGVSLTKNPTNTVYRWLIADPNAPGSLQPAGTRVSIPAPLWSVAPAPQGGPPIVQAVLPAEPPEIQQQFGDAMWVKVFVTEAAEGVELHHLVTDDPAVPQEASETETEWAILQAGPGGGNNELVHEQQAGADSKSVTRRYEFYEYTGAYDPESHEALCGGGGGGAIVARVGQRGGDGGGGCSAPLPNEIGNYIGAQMAAVNLVEEGVTPTPSETPTETPTEAPSAIDTPTATPTVGICAGNCNGDASVAINELVTLVNIALGLAEPSQCEAGIPAGAPVDIAMLIKAVNNALKGCA